jgi:hypothetical protein
MTVPEIAISRKIMTPIPFNQRRLAAWAGVIGPLLFVGVFTLEGWLRPGYNPLATYVSDLSIGPRGWIQIANFLVFGILMLIFTRAAAAEFPDGKASKGGVILLTIIAACYLASGPFVTDPIGTPLDQASVHGTIHGIFGAVVFMLMPISIFVFLRRFHADPRWQFLQGWTLVFGTISALGLILLTLATKSPAIQGVFRDWFGLIQRTAIVPFQLWLAVFALGMLQQLRAG